MLQQGNERPTEMPDIRVMYPLRLLILSSCASGLRRCHVAQGMSWHHARDDSCMSQSSRDCVLDKVMHTSNVRTTRIACAPRKACHARCESPL